MKTLDPKTESHHTAMQSCQQQLQWAWLWDEWHSGYPKTVESNFCCCPRAVADGPLYFPRFSLSSLQEKKGGGLKKYQYLFLRSEECHMLLFFETRISIYGFDLWIGCLKAWSQSFHQSLVLFWNDWLHNWTKNQKKKRILALKREMV